jgi:hypothetical protein
VPTDRGHAAIRALVRRIRRETGCAVPDVDPDGAGTTADVLVVLKDPGFGALTSKLLSLQNADQTTANQLRLFAAAKLPLEICLWWNAVPWDLGGLEPTAADLNRGAGYLQQLIALMDRPPVVVACGNAAHAACEKAGLAAIEICHPSSRGLYGGGENREPVYVAGLRKAGRQAVRARSRG